MQVAPLETSRPLDLPSDWTITRLGDIATVSAGGTPSRAVRAYWDGDIPWITTSQIDFNTIREAEQHISELGLRHSAAKMLPPGCLLMALYGQGKTRGKVAILGAAAAANQACAAIVVAPDVDSDYLFHFLASRYDEIRSKSNIGNQDNLNGAIVRSIEVVLPPLREQGAISSALSDLDELVNALERLIEKKRGARQAMLSELLVRRGKEWPTLPFARVFRRVDSKSHQIQTSEYGEYGTYPVIDQGQSPVVAYSDKVDKVLRCPPGGLIVFGDHTRVVKYADQDFVVGADGTQILSLEGANVARFFYYQLLTREIPNTGYNRHFKFLKEMSFAVPPPAEQESIARVLADVDDETAALGREADKARAVKVGMMQALLTARVRLLRDEGASSRE